MIDGIIQRVADKILQDAIDRDPVVYYEFVRGMKLNEWQKLGIRQQQIVKNAKKDYIVINGVLHVKDEQEVHDEITFKPLTFGENK